MDWTTIIVALLSGTTVASIIEAIRYRKQNSQIKTNEATQSSVETQKAEIDLANLYKEEMLKVIQLLKSSQVENNDNQTKMINKLDNLDIRLEKVEIKMDNIETYLNGPYHEWLANQGK